MNGDLVRDGWQRERPDLPTRSVVAVAGIWQAAGLLRARRATVLRGLGIDQATLELLANLRREGAPYELTPTVLSHRCSVTPAAISLRIRRAEQEGWVERTPDPTDARGVRVRLTEEGVVAAERFSEIVLRHDDALVAGLSDTELDTLEGLLRRLLDSVDASDHGLRQGRVTSRARRAGAARGSPRR